MTDRSDTFPSATDPPLELRSWHDNGVHAFSLTDPSSENGTSTLTLDIDHIVEWILKPGEKFYQFRIAPALLRFYGVFALKLRLDYSVGPIAVTPFQIDGVERIEEQTPYAKLMLWKMKIVSPVGEITFYADDWSLTFTGPAVLSDGQVLSRPLSRMDV
jgi:hypothetical protein